MPIKYLTKIVHKYIFYTPVMERLMSQALSITLIASCFLVPQKLTARLLSMAYHAYRAVPKHSYLVALQQRQLAQVKRA